MACLSLEMIQTDACVAGGMVEMEQYQMPRGNFLQRQGGRHKTRHATTREDDHAVGGH